MTSNTDWAREKARSIRQRYDEYRGGVGSSYQLETEIIRALLAVERKAKEECAELALDQAKRWERSGHGEAAQAAVHIAQNIRSIKRSTLPPTSKAEGPRMSDRQFPLQNMLYQERREGVKLGPASIPWSVAEKAYSVYASRYGRQQSLERLAERGGFSLDEMDEFYPAWRDETSEIVALRQRAADMTRALEAAKKYASYGVPTNPDLIALREALAALVR